MKNNVKFIEKTHQYFAPEGELVSVSKFTDRFKEKVDWNLIAKKSAAKATKNGVPTTQAQILKKWENKRNVSSQIGTLYHSIREQQLMVEPGSKKFCTYENGDKYSIPINDLEKNTVYPELIIYDIEHMLCGQSDKVVTTKDSINIIDYKTDQEIKFEAFRNDWVDPKKFLPPIDHLEECNGNLYAIKMSLYMYMLWKSNKGRFKPGELIIEHIHLLRDPDNDNIPVLQDGQPVVQKIDIIKLPYLKREVLAMLKTIK